MDAIQSSYQSSELLTPFVIGFTFGKYLTQIIIRTVSDHSVIAFCVTYTAYNVIHVVEARTTISIIACTEVVRAKGIKKELKYVI